MPDHIKSFEETQCPYCGKIHDSSYNADAEGQRPPVAGDPTICNRCAKVSVFNDAMEMAVPDRETLDLWKEQNLWPDIEAAVEHVKRGKHYRPQP